MIHPLIGLSRILFLTIIIQLVVPVIGFPQCLVSEDRKKLDALIAIEIGSSPQALSTYFFRHDLSPLSISPGQERVSFQDNFAHLDSVTFEFNYLNNALVNYGISKGGLKNHQVDSLYACSSSIVKRRFGQPIEDVIDAPEDGHVGNLLTYMTWKVDSGTFGISKDKKYDGYSFSIGHQADIAHPVHGEAVKPEMKPSEFVAPKALIRDKASEIIGLESNYTMKRNSVILPVYDQEDSQVGQIDMIYRHGGNYGPEIHYYFIQQDDSIRIGDSELFHHRSSSLLHYGRSNGRLSVLQNTRNEKLFIHLIDLPQGFVVIDLMKYIIAQESWMYYDYSNIGLYVEPTDTSSRLIVLEEATHRVKEFTGEINGDWAEVVLYEVDPLLVFLEPAYTGDILMKYWSGRQWKGWVRILNERGEIDNFKLYDAL